MKLYLTPLSHFARKVRIVAEFYNLNLEYIDVGTVTEIGIEKYAGNPLMGVPVLADLDSWLIESDNIISYLIDKNDPTDTLKFKKMDFESLNMRAVLNGLMSTEVKIIQGTRSGIAIGEYTYFKKAKASMEATLNWIEQRANRFDVGQLNFESIHLVCAIEHIQYFQTMDIDRYQKIKRIVQEVGDNTIVKRSNPFVLKPINRN